MADVSHLERMGRELKCPICLSLLNSAVSLTCNHVFCNSCLDKSMRSTFNCPVCKLPYRRREIHPAPHMDNLVSVYKSMEVASGVNMLVSQDANSSQVPGAISSAKVFDVENNLREHTETLASKKKKRRGSKHASVTNQRSSGDSIKPSYPIKKRVQVPLNAASENEMVLGNTNNEDIEADNEKKLHHRPPVSNNINHFVRHKNETVLPPLFWLRDEENSEKSSELASGNTPMYTPPDVPCFSDLKDLDEDVDGMRSPKDDNDMFNWTQRPCSPELCSSFLDVQIEDTSEKCLPSKKNNSEAETCLQTNSRSRKDRNKKRAASKIDSDGLVKKSKTKLSNATEIRKRKRATRNTTDDVVTPTEPDIVIHQEIQLDISDDPINLRRNTRTTVSSPSPFDEEIEVVNNSIGSVPDHPKDVTLRRNTRTTVSAPSPFDEGIEAVKNSILSVPDHSKDASRGSKVSSKMEYKTRRSMKRNQDGTPFCSKGNGIYEKLEEVHGAKDHSGTVASSEDNASSSLKTPRLLKCSTSAKTICCAFCRCLEESQVSGPIVCYDKGKLMKEIQNEGTNSIHVHKSCAEWAPNVYFDGSDIVNLETELSRSKRIRCSNCGLKGAALGCYEKSCRKSFHVPCARHISDCRWDYENFVILCPTHASSQLPCESQQSEPGHGKKASTKRNSNALPAKTAQESRSSSASKWASNSFNGLVLSFSGLNIEEKAIVNEFEKFSGAVIVKKWRSNVTHVIASTDENEACKRTLKFLMGILEAKWVLSFNWIKACMQAKGFVDEHQYEISIDIHGTRDGPRLGRLRLVNKQQRLLEGCKFFFMSDFEPSYKGYLNDLVTAAGGKVLNRKPIAGNEAERTFIIYSLEIPDKCNQSVRRSILSSRRAQAEALARSTGSLPASNSWILNSIAGYTLQDIGE